MRLEAFRIKNFRSIIDTDWHDFAPDNITGLIGQNESGKTSVLEGLMCFYDGKVTEDMLRSDLKMPEVYCKFSFEKGFLATILTKNKLPEVLWKNIEPATEIEIKRLWFEDKTSKILISQSEIATYFEKIENEKHETEKKVIETIEQTINEFGEAVDKLKILDNQRFELEANLSGLKNQKATTEKNLNKTRKQRLKEQYDEELTNINRNLEEIHAELTEILPEYEAAKQKREELEDLATVCLTYNSLKESIQEEKNAMNQAFEALRELENQYSFAVDAHEKKIVLPQVDEAKTIYSKSSARYTEQLEGLGFQLRVIKKVIDGLEPSKATREAKNEIDREQSTYNLETLGAEIFQYIPTFEFFEDFSSLLPNRIDLEDILKENTISEGYKAAKNFLILAGLDQRFFEQQNNRILKQKIERLNGEITISFQEYWRQKIGENNKINLNFELEHYDFTHPEKSGKPYLEFWIKDKNERLYPKQRSRGVRWFLSFYLELKASAKQTQKPRVLLIDEPGLSLHARAQEDVLKVFEDLRKSMQIVYTTHSPHLINVDKLYRLLAVQRANIDDYYSETKIYNARSLNKASTDTLSPIYSLMGTPLNDHQFIQGKNNIIVKDISSYYFYNAFMKLAGAKGAFYYLPATNIQNVPTLANLLMGWKIHFVVVLADDFEANKVYEELKKNMYLGNEEEVSKNILMMKKIKGAEDLLSTIDFKKHVLGERIGITELNSEYIVNNNLSGSVLASGFMRKVENKEVTFEMLDEESQENIKHFIKKLTSLLV